jgi:hypothetical protein
MPKNDGFWPRAVALRVIEIFVTVFLTMEILLDIIMIIVSKKITLKVRKISSWPRSWANSSLC